MPFLFIIDEAAHLFQSNYMHSFMWVLDQPIMKILTKLQIGISTYRTMISTYRIMTSTTERQCIKFLYFDARNTFSDLSLCTALYLSVGAIFYWRAIYSVGISQFGLGYWSMPSNGKSEFRASSHIENLVQWGRPLWNAVYDRTSSSEVNSLIIDKNG